MYINHNTDNYRATPIYKAFKEFFDSYLVKRDYEKTLSLLDDEMISIGTGEDEIAIGKDSFRELLKCEFEAIPDAINYSAKSFYAKEISEDMWEVFAEIDAIIPGSEVPYPTRYSGNFRLFSDGFVTSIHHMSESSNVTEEKEFLPIKFLTNQKIDETLAAQTVFDIMCKSMPGGVIAGYPTEGFPVRFCNENYLAMLGYDSYEEYFEKVQGLGVNNIHPDDRDMVNNEAMHSYEYDAQYAIEYRIQCKDGSYIHVYDIGRKVRTPDGEDILICVLYDMTENVKLKDMLIRESQYDELTAFYNR